MIKPRRTGLMDHASGRAWDKRRREGQAKMDAERNRASVKPKRKDGKRKRTMLVGVRLLPAEYAALKAAADEQRLTIPALLRRCALPGSSS